VVLFPARANQRGQIEPGAFERFAGECSNDRVVLILAQIERRQRRQAAPRPADDEAGEGLPMDAEGEEGSAVPATPPAAEQVQVSLQMLDLVPMDQIDVRLTAGIQLAVEADDPATPERLAATELLLKEARGHCPLTWRVWTADGMQVTIEPAGQWSLAPSAEAKAQLAAIWGADRLVIRWRDLAPEERVMLAG
jgi:hypothetical protein